MKGSTSAVAVASDLNKSARVPEVLQVVIEECGEARGCVAASGTSSAASPGTVAAVVPCPCSCEEVTVLGNTRDPSAFHGELGIAITGANTAPPGVIIHS